MIPQSEFRNPEYEEMISFAKEALRLSESIAIELSSLEGRGSDRMFFRLRWSRNDSVILVRYDPKRMENTYYADIAAFLVGIDVPVPKLIRHHSARCLILMEDLGDTDLWFLRKNPWEVRRSIYQKTLTAAHRLHAFPERDFPSSHVRLMEEFGPDLYRWERNYFMHYFVRDACGIQLEPSFERELEAELSKLAERLMATKRSLVHRDLQSQNVMVRGGEPFLIDFQGIRFGSLFYDLGSLLCDPYVIFTDSERYELLSFYYELSRLEMDLATFRDIFWEASAQRLMQALGAYGFLGVKKELRTYLDHIPNGLDNLHLATSQLASLPLLQQLTWQCKERLEKRR
jgi:hypothetical protein